MEADSSLVDEIRRRRRELSARFGDDLDQYVKHLRELEAQWQALVVSQIRVVPPSTIPATLSVPPEQLVDPTKNLER